MFWPAAAFKDVKLLNWSCGLSIDVILNRLNKKSGSAHVGSGGHDKLNLTVGATDVLRNPVIPVGAAFKTRPSDTDWTTTRCPTGTAGKVFVQPSRNI